jgi:nucleoside-diphosphate-sugar epimerase
MSQTKKVFLVGATGDLGHRIARALLSRAGVALHVLVRPQSRSRVAALEAAGATIHEGELGDPLDPRIEQALAGAFSVVSAVQGGPPIIIDAQLALFRAALRAGVHRFIPSDYAYDFFAVPEGANINSDWRRAFARQARDEQAGAAPTIQIVHVLSGCFLDRGVLFGFLGAIDPVADKALLWGDGEHAMDFTTVDDTAAFTAEAATDERDVPDHFNVAGDTLDFHGLVAAYQRGTGRALEVQHMGTLADLSAEIERSQRDGNAPRYLPLMYYRAMLDGTGKLGPLVNHRYPHIQPTTVEEYLRRERV